MKLLKTLVAAAALAATVPTFAAVVVLDFEGIGNLTPVGDYYNGAGPAAKNFGVHFSPATLAIVDADAGGTGNFANEPSPSTIMFFLDANNAVLDFAAGFTTGFSFFYTSSTAATVTVYDGLDKTGNVLGTLTVAAQFTGNNCVGDPTGTFCNWTAVGVAFAGVAKSIDFGGTANQTGYDNITFGSDVPVGNAPEPSTYALMALGLAAIGTVSRRRKAA